MDKNYIIKIENINISLEDCGDNRCIRLSQNDIPDREVYIDFVDIPSIVDKLKECKEKWWDNICD